MHIRIVGGMVAGRVHSGKSAVVAGISGVAAAAIALASVGILAGSEPAHAQGVNIEEIFWCDEAIGPLGGQTEEECVQARNVILNSCTTCHTFAPVVLAQRTGQQWDTFLTAHRDRAADISDEDYELIREFLKVHFNPENPPPDLPPALRNYTLPPA